jgi:hypothetical protein
MNPASCCRGWERFPFPSAGYFYFARVNEVKERLDATTGR